MTVKNLEYVIFLLVECDFYCIFAPEKTSYGYA